MFNFVNEKSIAPHGGSGDVNLNTAQPKLLVVYDSEIFFLVIR